MCGSAVVSVSADTASNMTEQEPMESAAFVPLILIAANTKPQFERNLEV